MKSKNAWNSQKKGKRTLILNIIIIIVLCAFRCSVTKPTNQPTNQNFTVTYATDINASLCCCTASYGTFWRFQNRKSGINLRQQSSTTQYDSSTCLKHLIVLGSQKCWGQKLLLTTHSQKFELFSFLRNQSLMTRRVKMARYGPTQSVHTLSTTGRDYCGGVVCLRPRKLWNWLLVRLAPDLRCQLSNSYERLERNRSTWPIRANPSIHGASKFMGRYYDWTGSDPIICLPHFWNESHKCLLEIWLPAYHIYHSDIPFPKWLWLFVKGKGMAFSMVRLLEYSTELQRWRLRFQQHMCRMVYRSQVFLWYSEIFRHSDYEAVSCRKSRFEGAIW